MNPIGYYPWGSGQPIGRLLRSHLSQILPERLVGPLLALVQRDMCRNKLLVYPSREATNRLVLNPGRVATFYGEEMTQLLLVDRVAAPLTVQQHLQMKLNRLSALFIYAQHGPGVVAAMIRQKTGTDHAVSEEDMKAVFLKTALAVVLLEAYIDSDQEDKKKYRSIREVLVDERKDMRTGAGPLEDVVYPSYDDLTIFQTEEGSAVPIDTSVLESVAFLAILPKFWPLFVRKSPPASKAGARPRQGTRMKNVEKRTVPPRIPPTRASGGF